MKILNKYLEKLIADKEILSRLINGGVWITLGGVFTKFISLLGTIFLARILGVEDFGKLGILISTVASFSMFAGAGMSLTSTKYISIYNTEGERDKKNQIIRLVLFISILFGFIFSSLLYLFSNQISFKLFNDESLVLPLKYISFSLIFISLNGAINGIVLGFQKFKQSSIFNIIFGLINYPLIVLLSWYFGIKGGAIGYSLSLMFYSIYLIINVYKTFIKDAYSDIQINILNVVKENKDILIHYSFPAIFGGALVAPVIWISDIIVANSHNGYENLGFFQAGNRIKEMIIFVPSVLSSMILPMLASANKNKDLFKDILKINLLINLSISIIISLFVVFSSKLIMKAFGNEFIDHWSILVIMALTSIFITYNSVIGKVIASNGNMWLGFAFNLFWGIFMISSTYFFVSVYKLGGEGYALAFLFSYFLHSIIQTIYIKNYKAKL